MKHGDGWKGWANKGPFDGIIVTAAASHMPTDLYQQLNDGGMLVIPVGTDEQKLHCVVRHGDEFTSTIVESVRFVPLVAGEII